MPKGPGRGYFFQRRLPRARPSRPPSARSASSTGWTHSTPHERRSATPIPRYDVHARPADRATGAAGGPSALVQRGHFGPRRKRVLASLLGRETPGTQLAGRPRFSQALRHRNKTVRLRYGNRHAFLPGEETRVDFCIGARRHPHGPPRGIERRVRSEPGSESLGGGGRDPGDRPGAEPVDQDRASVPRVRPAVTAAGSIRPTGSGSTARPTTRAWTGVTIGEVCRRRLRAMREASQDEEVRPEPLSASCSAR